MSDRPFIELTKTEREGYITRYIKFAGLAEKYCILNAATERGYESGEWVDALKESEEAHRIMIAAWRDI